MLSGDIIRHGFSYKDITVPPVPEGHKSPGKQLLCLCNDNKQCLFNPIPRTHLERMNTVDIEKKSYSEYGHCVTSFEGGCYSVKQKHISGYEFGPELYSNRRKRRRIRPEQHSILSNPYGVENGPVSLQESKTAIKRVPDGSIHQRYGCLSSHSKMTLSCNVRILNHPIPTAISCCNSSDFCNALLQPKFPHQTSDTEALRRQRSWKHNLASHDKQRIRPEMNSGPELLQRGEAPAGYVTNSNYVDAPHSTSISTRMFNYTLLASFGITVIVLTLTILAVYYCYRHKMKRAKFKEYESILWRNSPHGSGVNSRSILPNSVTSSWMSDSKLITTKNIEVRTKKKKGNGRYEPGGFSLQTNSTHLTQEAGSCSDMKVIPVLKHESLRPSQRTISKQVTLHRFLGRGRFSDVWMGTWRGESILAKVFLPNNRLAQSLWRRTASAHRSMLLRHQATQGLIAVDWIYYPCEEYQSILDHSKIPSSQASHFPALCAMLIGELHCWGTLRDLMAHYRWQRSRSLCADPSDWMFQLTQTSQSSPILSGPDEMLLRLLLRLSLSLTQGLCFLHSEYAGTRGKPALAHRNLKPSNIFVRADWTCCIGDIGLSVRPMPTPAPIQDGSELMYLYDQYVTQLGTTPTTATDPSDNPVPSNLSGSQLSRLPDSRSQCSSALTMGLESPLAGTSGAVDWAQPPWRSTDATRGGGVRMSVDKVDQLDWWPVGGIQCGTPRYMAPELLNKDIQPFCFESHQKADIYSLGLIIWELITWILPSSGSFGSCTGPIDADETDGRVSISPSRLNLSEEEDSASCGSINATDPNCSSHTHCPAYQSEWDLWYSRMRIPVTPEADLNETVLGSDEIGSPRLPLIVRLPNVEVAPPSEANLTEPDLSGMQHLVCVLNLRPTLVLGPTTATHGSRQQQNSCDQLCHSREWAHPFPTNENAAEATRHRDTSVAEVTAIEKHAWLEASSSGASSLKEVHTSSTGSAPPELTRLDQSVLVPMTTLLSECWHANPNSRVTALRVRKTLQRIEDQLTDSSRGDVKPVPMQEPLITPQQTTCPTVRVIVNQQHSNSSTIKANS